MFRCGTVTQSVWMTRYTAFGSSRHIANHLKSSNPLSAGNLCHRRRMSSKISFHSRRTYKLLTENALLISSNIVYLLLILSNFHYMNLVSYLDDINRLRSDLSDTKTFVWFILQEGTLALWMVLEGPDAAVVCPFEWSSLALGHSRLLYTCCWAGQWSGVVWQYPAPASTPRLPKRFTTELVSTLLNLLY